MAGYTELKKNISSREILVTQKLLAQQNKKNLIYFFSTKPGLLARSKECNLITLPIYVRNLRGYRRFAYFSLYSHEINFSKFVFYTRNCYQNYNSLEFVSARY